MEQQASARGETLTGPYTQAQFTADFPQFLKKEEPNSTIWLPEGILELLLLQCNDAILPDRWGVQWRLACGLYMAHHATLYLRTYAEGTESAAAAAESGAAAGLVHSASLGVDSITYDNQALTSATNPWGSLNATQYGQQLATMARLVGMGGCYVI